MPLLHVAFGTFGGWIGYTIWRPVQTDGPADPTQRTRKAGAAARRGPRIAGRVAWFRVLLGAVVAAAGYMTAAAVFSFLIDFSAGRLSSDGWWQDRVVTWEIQALAVLLGGAVAGFNTSNGLKQGLCVGLPGLGFPDGLLFGFSRTTPEVTVLTVAGCFCLCASAAGSAASVPAGHGLQISPAGGAVVAVRPPVCSWHRRLACGRRRPACARRPIHINPSRRLSLPTLLHGAIR